MAYAGTVIASVAFANTAGAAVLQVPGDFATIQACLDGAGAGDECVVAPGTYNELINFHGKAITLRSSDGPQVTIIDAGPVPDPGTGKPVVRCDTNEGPATVLHGFTITGGTGSVCFGSSTCIGGMYNEGASPAVTDCMFTGNSATLGAGVYSASTSNPTVSDCVFNGNTAQFGGGMWNEISPTVTNCTFIANSARGRGGGMYNSADSSPTVINCTFRGNSGAIGGAMANAASASPPVTNCTFSGNTASDRGGGMCNFTQSSPTVTNCTFSGNSDAAGGGGVFSSGQFSGPLTPALRNCVLWDNTPDQIVDVFGAVTTVIFSDVQGMWPGVGNIDAVPMFARNPSDGGDGWGDDPDTPDVDEGANDDFGDLRLLPGSPCIAMGDNAALPPDILDLDGDGDTLDAIPFDLDGHARVLCTVVDMGAYESGIGDGDCDQDVDLGDFGAYWDCITGPAISSSPGCEPFDFGLRDGHVDLFDLAGFQRAFTGMP